MDYRRIEEEALMWIDTARTNPMGLVPELKELLGHFDGLTFRDPQTGANIETNEGQDAVYEAIAFVKSVDSMQGLKTSKGLSQAARDHCDDIGPNGGASHAGSDGSTMSDRIEK